MTTGVGRLGLRTGQALMRCWLVCLGLGTLSSGALAGGLDFLRGSADAAPAPQIGNLWQGVYFGGHSGYTNVSVDFGSASQSQIDYLLRNDVVGRHVAGWTTLGKREGGDFSFGGFLGYNIRFEDAIVGFELNYNRFKSNGVYENSRDSMTRSFHDDTNAPAGHHFFYTATVTSFASIRMLDYGTVRARAAVALDRFLPYAFVAGALGRADVVRSATVSYIRQDTPDTTTPPALPITPLPDFIFGPETNSAQQGGVFAYGYGGGVGMDVALLPNVFVRGEWEYIEFLPIQGVKVHLNTARLGAGLKF